MKLEIIRWVPVMIIRVNRYVELTRRRQHVRLQLLRVNHVTRDSPEINLCERLVLALQAGIPPVFDRVGAAARQLARDDRPAVPYFLLLLEDDLILPRVKRLVFDIWREAVVPALAALLARPCGNEFRDVCPFLRTELVDGGRKLLVLLLGPRTARDHLLLLLIHWAWLLHLYDEVQKVRRQLDILRALEGVLIGRDRLVLGQVSLFHLKLN